MQQNKKEITWIVPQGEAGQRLDSALTRLPLKISRSQWKRLINEGMVRIGESIPQPSHTVKPGEEVIIEIPPPEPLTVQPEDIPLDILYEDGALVVINKPAGLVVHPGAGHAEHTLVNALLHHCPDLTGIGGKQRPGIVHRLDKETSGLLVAAKTDQAHQSLSLQIKERKVNRRYIALVYGSLTQDKGEVHTLIGRHPVDRKIMSIHPRRGRDAITYWRVKERFIDFTLLELQLGTGRTHQIRVHMSSINHPVVGDRVYGRNRLPHITPLELKSAIADLPGQALHAQALGFCHPETGECLEFSAPPPEVIQRILDILRRV
jgi:23S rRNA pseudouridine1911/1915/1917 synthase